MINNCARRARTHRTRFWLAAVMFLLSGIGASRAEAYQWMIRHGHEGCVQCHMDPSGAGLLTSYGREQGDEELPMRYRSSSSDGAESRGTGPVWGAFETPMSRTSDRRTGSSFAINRLCRS